MISQSIKMANLSEDIQCAGSDSRPPMLDRTDFASWQQRIRLYCQGKENRVNILKSINEGPFQMGTFRETLAEGTEGALHLGPERPRVYSDLLPKDKERYNADIRVTNILLQGFPKDIYSLINHYTDAKDIWDNVKMLLEDSKLTKEDQYAIGTCPKTFNQRDKKHAPTPVIRKKQVTFKEQCDMSNSNTHKHVEKLNTQKTNVSVSPSTRVNCCTNASRLQPRSNTKKNRISPAKGVNKKKVEEHPRINKSNLRTMNRVDSTSSSKRTVFNLNSNFVCQTCNKCLISVNHDVCVVDYLQSVKASPSINNIHNVVRKVKQVWKPKQVRKVWKPTGKVLANVSHQWRPTGRIFTLGEQCPLTRH
ncbi:hypothetical protein Tco_0681366 [Tanacetum coccineum]|uniref:Integrase, catalytic region, zinc finger, CCHC-type, peptidase aspartic, catalytic n=1 Tax=Tanacetum coccineum TaxID=301880 RepID=A0ABQ4XP27_9ASTR